MAQRGLLNYGKQRRVMSSGEDKQHLIWCLGATMNPDVFMCRRRLKALHVGYKSNRTLCRCWKSINQSTEVCERKCLNLYCGWKCVLCSPELKQGSILLKINAALKLSYLTYFSVGLLQSGLHIKSKRFLSLSISLSKGRKIHFLYNLKKYFEVFFLFTGLVFSMYK